MEKRLKLPSLRTSFVISYFEIGYYDIIVVQNPNGDALYIQIINLEK